MEVFCVYSSHKIAHWPVIKLGNLILKKSSTRSNIENMSKVPEKETPTAPPSSPVAYSSVAPVFTAPPVAGYPVQQIPLEGRPVVQNQAYPAAYPENYQQQYHPAQPGQIVISPTSQTTPLMVDPNRIKEIEKQQNLHQQLYRQQQQHVQQQQRRRAQSESLIEECCCCCCESLFDSCLCIVGKTIKVIACLFALALIGLLIMHFLGFNV